MDHSILQREMLANAAPLVDKFQKRVDIVEDSIKDSGKSHLNFDDFQKASLAIMLDNVEKELLRYKKYKRLSDRTYSEAVGPFKKHAFNIISAMYSTMDIAGIISMQPMTQKKGALYYMTTKYGSNKGAISEGDTAFSAKVAGTRSRYYSSPIVKNEAITLTYDGSTNTTATLEYHPLKDPSTISLVITGGAAAGTWTYLSTSGTNYQLQKAGSGTADGTIGINTGIFTVAGDAATDNTAAVITYTWNSQKFSSSVPIPRVTVAVEEQDITAERRNLLVDMMLDTTFDFESQFGQSLDAAMQQNVIQLLQNEMSFRVLGEMYDSADGGGSFSFDKTPSAGLSKVDHAAGFAETLGEMSTQIRNNIGRGTGNKIITGDGFIEFVDMLGGDKWKPAPVPDGNGPYYAGKLFGKYDVYYNPDMSANTFMMTYRGNDWWSAPYYVGTYLPLMNSQFLVYPDMHGEQGFIAMDAYQYEFPKSVVKGTLTTS